MSKIMMAYDANSVFGFFDMVYVLKKVYKTSRLPLLNVMSRNSITADPRIKQIAYQKKKGLQSSSVFPDNFYVHLLQPILDTYLKDLK